MDLHQTTTPATPIPGYIFKPQPDITVAELAEVLATVLNFQGSVFQPDIMAAVPASCVRHFEDNREAQLKTLLFLAGSGS